MHKRGTSNSTCNQDDGTIQREKSSKTVKETSKINLIFGRTMWFIHIVKLYNPTWEIYAHPFVPLSNSLSPIQIMVQIHHQNQIFIWNKQKRIEIKRRGEIITWDVQEGGFSCKNPRCPTDVLLPSFFTECVVCYVLFFQFEMKRGKVLPNGK